MIEPVLFLSFPDKKKISAIDAFLQGNVDMLPAFVDNKQKESKGYISTDDYDCPLELVRFFTPFGVKAYNSKVNIPGMKWREQAVYKQEVTHLITELRGEVWIGVTIGNYDKGGHKLTMELEYFPWNIKVVEKVFNNYVQPLFYNLPIIPDQQNHSLFAYDSLEVEFTLPDNIKNLKMMYITTGHGGWGGGDEFNQKINAIYVDGQKEYVCIPWRTDCATYRDINPASGNSWNGVSSSDFSRSNWAPGTTTNSIIVPLFDLKLGKHTMKIAIHQGEGSSSWNVSGVLIGEYK